MGELTSRKSHGQIDFVVAKIGFAMMKIDFTMTKLILHQFDQTDFAMTVVRWAKEERA